jgi:hypothetical protein
MWGDFITDEGIYNFKNLGVIDKKFNLKPWRVNSLGGKSTRGSNVS